MIPEGVTDEDEELFLREVEDFKIFNRRHPTLLEEGNIWQRIEDRKLLDKREKEAPHDRDIAPE